MPDKPLTAVRKHFCRIYCVNGHNAAQAYKTAYPNTKSGYNAHGARLIAKDSIQQEISHIEAESRAEQGRTVQSIDEMYQTAYDAGMVLKQPSAMVSAATGIARLYGMDKDNDMGADKPLEHTPEQIQEYRDMAQAANKSRIRLSKEAV